ncbi:XRE family transcriptional regulator [Aerococcaceae bacterium NML160702]|nr:XRE family transcriptional regulator [Aerococcaceae bacterium NML160702]
MTIADLTLIEKVLKEQTGYRISKETGIYQSTINRWTLGITPLENMSIKHGILLTELALKIEKENRKNNKKSL